MRSVGVRTSEDTNNDDVSTLRVNLVQHPVRATASAVTISERGLKPLPDTMRVVEQRPDDKLERRERNRFR